MVGHGLAEVALRREPRTGEAEPDKDRDAERDRAPDVAAATRGGARVDQERGLDLG